MSASLWSSGLRMVLPRTFLERCQHQSPSEPPSADMPSHPPSEPVLWVPPAESDAGRLEVGGLSVGGVLWLEAKAILGDQGLSA